MAVTRKQIIGKKNFYRDKFRATVWILFVSLIANGVLLLLIAFFYFTRPLPDFYATNSASSVTPLVAMEEPNMSSKALLKPDPPEEIKLKRVTI